MIDNKDAGSIVPEHRRYLNMIESWWPCWGGDRGGWEILRASSQEAGYPVDVTHDVARRWAKQMGYL